MATVAEERKRTKAPAAAPPHTAEPPERRETFLGAEAFIEELCEYYKANSHDVVLRHARFQVRLIYAREALDSAHFRRISRWEALGKELRDLQQMVDGGTVTMAEGQRAEIERRVAALYAECRGRVGRFPMPGQIDLNEKLMYELRQFVLAPLRAAPDVDPSPRNQLFGLALSGGGVRSASFCLGVLQALATRRLLTGLHYLSAVSGGGYIASWLTAWAYRAHDGLRSVQEQLAEGRMEPGPVRWLRRYGVYLAPRFSPYSVDAWAVLTTWFRAWVPIFLMVVGMLTVAALVPYLYVAAGKALTMITGQVMIWKAILLTVCLLVTSTGFRRYTLFQVGSVKKDLEHAISPLAVVGAVVIAPVCAVLLRSLNSPLPETKPYLLHVAGAAVLYLVSYALAALWAWIDSLGKKEPRRRKSLGWWRASTATMGAGATVGALLLPLSLVMHQIDVTHVVVFGPLALVAAIGLGEVIAAMMIADTQDDVDRVWWAKTAAISLMASTTWTTIAAVVVYGPGFLVSEYALAWVGGAILLIVSPVVGAKMLPAFSDRFYSIMSGLAALMALCFLSWTLMTQVFGIDPAVAGRPLALPPAPAARPTWPGLMEMLIALPTAVAAVWILSSMVNVNRFSLHSLYREGLIRTYLGASRGVADAGLKEPQLQEGVQLGGREPFQFQARASESFSDVDDNDNVNLAWLRPGRFKRREIPFLLLNASVNGQSAVQKGGQTSLQHPFTFGTMFCGSPVAEIGYTRTDQVFKTHPVSGGLTLGTAMAVSGAAVSPTAGRHTDTGLAFFLTLLNLRLGLWMGNPRNPKIVAEGASGGAVKRLFVELLGRRLKFGDWIHVSDGGHFENLGLYELVRRGCKFIISVDASADPRREGGDFANTLRRIEIDLSTEIVPLMHKNIGLPHLAKAGRCWGLFEIRYPGTIERGLLIYIKPSVYENVPIPVSINDYWKRHPAFPHEATLNQFFTEEQLEAYRALGRKCLHDTMDQINSALNTSPSRLEESMGDLKAVLGRIAMQSGVKSSS